MLEKENQKHVTCMHPYYASPPDLSILFPFGNIFQHDCTIKDGSFVLVTSDDVRFLLCSFQFFDFDFFVVSSFADVTFIALKRVKCQIKNCKIKVFEHFEGPGLGYLKYDYQSGVNISKFARLSYNIQYFVF